MELAIWSIPSAKPSTITPSHVLPVILATDFQLLEIARYLLPVAPQVDVHNSITPSALSAPKVSTSTAIKIAQWQILFARASTKLTATALAATQDSS